MTRAQRARRMSVYVGPSRLYDRGAVHRALNVDERAKQTQSGAYQYRRGDDPQCATELEHTRVVTFIERGRSATRRHCGFQPPDASWLCVRRLRIEFTHSLCEL